MGLPFGDLDGDPERVDDERARGNVDVQQEAVADPQVREGSRCYSGLGETGPRGNIDGDGPLAANTVKFPLPIVLTVPKNPVDAGSI